MPCLDRCNFEVMAPVTETYRDFAWFYERYWNEEFHSLAFPILERIWLPSVAEGGRILDVCCGTGYLAGLLVERGYRVTGIDASEAMIRHARERAPEAEFQVADAARFEVVGPFDAAVSTFDSLNHIAEPGDLQACMRRVAGALKPGGRFAFDMLAEDAYRTRWGESFALVRDDHVLTISGSGFDFRTRLARCMITMFRLIEGQWRRSDAVVQERCYSPEEIEGALRDAGFDRIQRFNGHEVGMGGQLGEGRVFYVASVI
jgi:SAM-dependent methyltransferase